MPTVYKTMQLLIFVNFIKIKLCDNTIYGVYLAKGYEYVVALSRLRPTRKKPENENNPILQIQRSVGI